MAGNFIGLFAKRCILRKIKEPYVCQVKTGAGGMTKNKGSCALRFRIDETSFAFLNCHLASGNGEIHKRTEMVRTILHEAFLKAKSLPRSLAHNCVFLFGDLNFRVNLSNEVVRSAIKDKRIEHILQYDELL